MSISHWYSHTILKYCSNVIYESGYKLGLLQWEIRASLIRYRIDKLSKPLWKISKLTSSNINEVIKTILDFFIQNSFLNGPKKLVFVRMWDHHTLAAGLLRFVILLGCVLVLLVLLVLLVISVLAKSFRKNKRIQNCPSILIFITTLTFTIIYWEVLEAALKSKQPLTLSCILSPPLQPRHIPNTSGHCQPI